MGMLVVNSTSSAGHGAGQPHAHMTPPGKSPPSPASITARDSSASVGGKGLRSPKVQGRPLHRQDAARLIHQARLEVGAAYVNANIHVSLPPLHSAPPSARRSTRRASSWAALYTIAPLAVVHGRHLHDAGKVPARPHRDGQVGHLDVQDLGKVLLDAQPVVKLRVVPLLETGPPDPDGDSVLMARRPKSCRTSMTPMPRSSI